MSFPLSNFSSKIIQIWFHALGEKPHILGVTLAIMKFLFQIFTKQNGLQQVGSSYM